MFEQTVDAFLTDHATPAATRQWRVDGRVDPQLWRLAGEAGLLGLQVPPEYGGAGVDFRYDATLMERLGLHHALNFAIPLHLSLIHI